MGDMAEIYREWNARKKERRKRLGIPCPQCNVLQPKRCPTILMPGQKCKVDGYIDPRPRQ